MRSIIFRPALLTVFSGLSLAAFPQEKLLHFGVVAEGTLSTLKYTDSALGEGEASVGFGIAGQAFYDISPRLQLVSGLGIRRLAVSQKDYSILLGCDHDGNGGPLPFNSWLIEEFKPLYLGIPAEVRLKIVGEEKHLFFQAGLEWLLNVGSDNKAWLVECATTRTELPTPLYGDFTNSLFMIKASIGVEFPIVKKRKIFLYPTLAYSLNTIFADRATNSRFLNAGLVAGLKL